MFKGLIFFFRLGWTYDKRYVLWNILNQLLSSLLPIAASLLPKFIIDELTGAQDVRRILLYIALFPGYTLLAGVFSSYFFHDGFVRRCRVSARFDEELHRRLARADLRQLENPAFRDMKEKAMKFLTCDWHGFGYLLDCALKIIGQCVTLLGVTAIICSLSPWMALAFAALSLISVRFEGRMRRRAFALSETVVGDQRRWMYCASLFEDMKFAKEIRLNRLSGWLLDRERRDIASVNSNLQTQHRLFFRSDALTAAFTFVQQTVSYVLLAFRALNGLIGIGDFTMYTGAVTAFGSALRSVAGSLAEISAYDMYYDRLDEFLSLPETIEESGSLPAPKENLRIEFINVGYRYAGSEKWALRHINLTLEPGEKLSVVGENGSGKSTFAKLLCRMYDPNEGEIRIGGVDIRTIAIGEYLSLLCAVFQDFQLFAAPLRDNIALGTEASDEQILHALDQVGLSGFVNSLPRGLDTHVDRLFDQNGVIPSGGEGQRIALARALIRNAPIVLLDEPTAALDPRAEYEILHSFHRLTEGKTAVYISHRLSSSRFADRIVVFHEGCIAECGTHNELTALDGRYAGLFRMQAQFYTEIP